MSAAPAFAGEITGPPGTPGVEGSASGHRTPAVTNARSGCAANGLNDMNPAQGQIDLIVQNYGANKKLGLDPEVDVGAQEAVFGQGPLPVSGALP